MTPGDPPAAAALRRERRRGHRLHALIWGLALLLAAGAGLAWGRHSARFRGVAARTARLSVGSDGPPISAARRDSRPELWFRVVLDPAPQGERLRLECDWRAPEAAGDRHSRYETRLIDHSPWPTWCRQRFDPSSPAGLWHVSLQLDGRELGATDFELR